MNPTRRHLFPLCAASLSLLAASCGGEPAPEGDPPLVCSAPPTVAAPQSASGFTPSAGPGGPKRSFTSSELQTNCAYLTSPDDKEYHNAVTMYDGYLIMPWAPEFGGGGISVYEFDDPCAPVHVGTGLDAYMRETHATGFSFIGGRYAVVNSITGIQFWDLSNMAAPRAVSRIEFQGVFWPDAYARVVLSVFWQAPYVYVAAADNGVFVVDAADPANPKMLARHKFDPPLRAGAVFAVGNLLVVMATEGSRTAMFDISDPAKPVPIPGGTFEIKDKGGVQRDAYFGHINGDKTWYARKSQGGGLIVYDIKDPSVPTFVGDYHSVSGNGGYVFLKEGMAFIGESSFAEAVDVTDPANPTLAATFMNHPGDLDMAIPIGNVVILSCDDKAPVGQATGVVPFLAEPDTAGPVVNMVNPRDGETALALTTRIGLTFNEFVDLSSLWAGSFLVRKVGTIDPLDGHYSGQEGIANFWPKAPLEPETTYEVVVPPGGVVDFNGNPTTAEFRSTFTTGPCVLPPPPRTLDPQDPETW